MKNRAFTPQEQMLHFCMLSYVAFLFFFESLSNPASASETRSSGAGIYAGVLAEKTQPGSSNTSASKLQGTFINQGRFVNNFYID